MRFQIATQAQWQAAVREHKAVERAMKAEGYILTARIKDARVRTIAHIANASKPGPWAESEETIAVASVRQLYRDNAWRVED